MKEKAKENRCREIRQEGNNMRDDDEEEQEPFFEIRNFSAYLPEKPGSALVLCP